MRMPVWTMSAAGNVLLLVLLSLPQVFQRIHGSFFAAMLGEPALLVAAGCMTGRMVAGDIGRIAWLAPALATLSVCTIMLWQIPILIDHAGEQWTIDLLRHACLYAAGGVALGLSWRALGAIGRAFLATNGIAMFGMMGVIEAAYSGQLCALYPVEEQHALGKMMILATPLLMASWLAFYLFRRPQRQ